MVVGICLVIGSFVVAVCHVGASLALMCGPWKLDAWNYMPAWWLGLPGVGLLANTKMLRAQEEDRSRMEPSKSPFSSLLSSASSESGLIIQGVDCCWGQEHWKGTSGGIIMRRGDFLFHIQLWKIVSLSSVSCYHTDSKLPLDSASWPGLVLILSSWWLRVGCKTGKNRTCLCVEHMPDPLLELCCFFPLPG